MENNKSIIIGVDGKEYRKDIMSPENTKRFTDNLYLAINCIDYANVEIEPLLAPYINQEVINDLETASGIINRILTKISSGEIQLYTPQSINDSSHCYHYKMDWFIGRDRRGTVYLETDLDIEDFESEDKFLEDLVRRGSITREQVNTITDIDKIDME